MKKLLLTTLLASSLLGCATERYFGGNGVEALVYKEHHSFSFVIKNKTETERELRRLVAKIESTDNEATYVIDYKKISSKRMLENIFAQYPAHVAEPKRAVYRHANSLPNDLRVRVTLRLMKTQQCLPAQIEVESRQSDCFLESTRLKQVSYKSKLVGEQ
jgi:hypothetical protein